MDFLSSLFSWGDKKEQKPQKQQQQHKQKKEQMVDQNFANNTLFMTLSDIEAIEQKYQNNTSKPKQFGMYDPVDYSHREVEVLKEQLRIKLFLVKNSLFYFKQEYGQGAYQLPKDFDEKKVFNRISGFQETFRKCGDQACYKMCEDLKNMLEGKNTNCYFETAKFKNAPNVSQQENVKGMLNANNRMRDEKKQFQAQYKQNMEARDIKFKENPNYKEFEKDPKNNPNQKTLKLYKLKYKQGQYTGQVVNGIPNGKGSYLGKDFSLSGMWMNGELDGEAIYKDNYGKIQKRIYKNGKLVSSMR